MTPLCMGTSVNLVEVFLPKAIAFFTILQDIYTHACALIITTELFPTAVGR